MKIRFLPVVLFFISVSPVFNTIPTITRSASLSVSRENETLFINPINKDITEFRKSNVKNVCLHPLAICPAPGTNCTCCDYDMHVEPSESSLENRLFLYNFIVFILSVAVLKISSWGTLYGLPKGPGNTWNKREKSSSLTITMRRTCQLGNWLVLAILAPLFYVPEVQHRDSTSKLGKKRKKSTTKEQTRVDVEYQDQQSQTTGSSNRRSRDQSRGLELLENTFRAHKFRMLRKRRLMLHKFKQADRRYMEETRCKNQLISQAHCQSIKTGRELWFIESVIKSLRMELESQQRQNRQVIQRYNLVHKQVLEYAATGAGDQL